MEYPGEKLVIRLWETLAEKGIGGLLRPWQTRREGRAQADIQRNERLVLAQTERDVEDIRSGRKTLTPDGQLLEPHAQDSPLEAGSSIQKASAIVRRHRIAQEMRAEVNVSKALLSAEAELENDPQTPPERKVDDDWLFRWRDAASTVSSEELQTLWGRMIAGEIKSPGYFSLRTLDFVKNLSQKDALQIAKMLPFVIDGDVISGVDEKLLKSVGITFEFLLNLQYFGLVSGVEMGGINKTLRSIEREKFERAITSYNRMLLVTHEDAGKEIKLNNVYKLTSLGQQVLRLGSFEAHDVYLRSVGKTICLQGFKVQIARYEQVTETTGRYFEPEEICAKTV